MGPANRPSPQLVPDRLLSELEATGLVERIEGPGGPRYEISGWVRRVVVARTPTAQGGEPPVVMSRREQSVLEALAVTGSRQAIANAQFVSLNTVKTQLASVYRKLGARSRAEVLVEARRRGLLPPA